MKEKAKRMEFNGVEVCGVTIPHRVKVNGAVTMLHVNGRFGEEGWDMVCVDPLVDEFHLQPGDVIHKAFQGKWIPETKESMLWEATQGKSGPEWPRCNEWFRNIRNDRNE